MDATNKKNPKPQLALLVGVGVTGHDGADGRESDAGHGCNGSSSPHHPTTSNTHQLKDTNNSTAVKPSGRSTFLFEAGATDCYDCTVVCLIVQTAVIEPTGRTFKVQHVKATVIRSYFPLLHHLCFYCNQNELFTLHRKKNK